MTKAAPLAGIAPDQLAGVLIDDGQAALTAAIGQHRPGGPGAAHLTGALFGARTVLFHLGVLDTLPGKHPPNRQAARDAAWASVPSRLAATLLDYIAQTRLSLRPGTMVRVEGVLREFACWLAACAPEESCVADLRRSHIEAYKLHLASRPSARGGKLSKISLAEHLGTLRTCFERLTEWDGNDVPARILVFSGDLPLRDEPLPKFLDDAAFTKLLQAARADDDPFVRLAVEFLARTGMFSGGPDQDEHDAVTIRTGQRLIKSGSHTTGVARNSLSGDGGRQSSSDNEHHIHEDLLQKPSAKHLVQRRATGWGTPEKACARASSST